MPLTYATTADLSDFTDTPEEDLPAKHERWLTLASALVRDATRTAVYDTEPSGAPSDSDVADAFTNATCAQVAAWMDLGVDPTTGPGGVDPGVVESSGIGGATVKWSSSAQATAKAATVDELVPEAMLYLVDLERVVTVWG
jgi:hypothetical protein